MPKGRIVKSLSGFYYVESDGEIFQCRARGNFRNRGITPIVGDWVEYEAENKTDGYIMEVHDRSSSLRRPPVANVDQAVIVSAVEHPAFSTLILDKLLVHTEAAGMDAVIVITKKDLGVTEDIEEACLVYRQLGYPVILTAHSEGAAEELRSFLEGKVSVFAGQSGVGKSTLLNTLHPELGIETGEVSKSLKRGKHTTRHVELIPIEGGYVADTPGFSSLDFSGIEEEVLSHYFPEMAERINDCRFRGCRHLNEPGCEVQAAVEQGDIASFRYKNYKQFHEEISSQKRRY
ncbi:ribosome small subunit-dependent GTPase A [Alkalicoccus urumqiensis]|uniref:Small ribosomal subunit biogenesis GTPase RsgA n=1 Tax=Alkalicoccus urumqiensis TaxID=1548213 RepID=A0A2P6MGD6_ALKUR|nr:ribosome small subunit-dependent GTPase A [Alkalicoccus urumqiensis]PRO65331.1 ribosome small subunit-dependent GTPase A [Alkalicoccus urumqiensis]